MPLTSPVLSSPGSTPDAITLQFTAPGGGTAPYTYDLHRSTTVDFTPAVGNRVAANVPFGVGTFAEYEDDAAGLEYDRLFYYKLVTTDSAGSPATVISNQVTTGVAFGLHSLTQAMSLTQARDHVIDAARNAGDPDQYPSGSIDRALQSVGNQFCRNTRAVRDYFSATLADGDDSVTVSTGKPLMPENLMDVTWDDQECPVQIVTYEEFNKRRACDPDATGVPTIATVLQNADAVSDGTFDLLLYPANDDTRTLTVRLWQYFKRWVPGVSAGTADVLYLNIPYAWLTLIIPTGVVGRLQATAPEHGYGRDRLAEYDKIERSLGGAGNLGEKTVIRARLR